MTEIRLAARLRSVSTWTGVRGSRRLLPEEERSSEAGILTGRLSLAQAGARLSSAKLGKGFFLLINDCFKLIVCTGIVLSQLVKGDRCHH